MKSETTKVRSGTRAAQTETQPEGTTHVAPSAPAIGSGQPNKTTERPTNEEMVQGYMDGWDLDAPQPSNNRSHSYRHGFECARDDRLHRVRGTIEQITQWADEAMEKDEGVQHVR